MSKLKVIWSWLDGRKTYIGAAFYGLGWLLAYSSCDPAIPNALKDLGVALGGLGVIHKIFKAGESKGFEKGVSECQANQLPEKPDGNNS